MCKSWNPEMQKTLDNIVESIKNINYKDLLSNIKRFKIYRKNKLKIILVYEINFDTIVKLLDLALALTTGP